MNKNPKVLERRRNDLIKKIDNSKRMKLGDVISKFARDHYLSESTVWKDYERALNERENRPSPHRESKRF